MRKYMYAIVLFSGFILIACMALQSSFSLHNYMNFADQKNVFGIPHFFDVTSNLVFFFVGIYALQKKENSSTDLMQSMDLRLRVLGWAFIGVAIGSSYFHWMPTVDRLFWDRLPMTIVFCTLTSLIISDRISFVLGMYVWLPLVLFGFFSILFYHFLNGSIVFYVLVQFGSLWFTLITLLFYPKGRLSIRWFLFSGGIYIIAKMAETWDLSIYQRMGVSGHTMKHLLSGLAGYFLILGVSSGISEKQSQKSSLVG